MAFLLCHPFFHEISVTFLLFYDMVLGSQWCLKAVAKFNNTSLMILLIKESKLVYFGRDSGIIQQQKGSIHLPMARVVGSKERMICVINIWGSHPPCWSCMQWFDIDWQNKIVSPESDQLGSIGGHYKLLGRL